MEPLTFSILTESMLNLFEIDKKNKETDGGSYNCAYIYGKTQYSINNYHLTYEKFFGGGDMENFRNLLKQELDKFFVNFEKYFHTDDDRINKRRLFVYEKLVNRKLCRRGPFKRDFLSFLDGELYACYDMNIGDFFEKYKDITVRQNLLFASAKNFIYRTFYIYEHCPE